MVILTGPTAVGKTALAARLATAMDAEVLSVDSRQIYRFMDIGTAKPSTEVRRAVPHHLIDMLDPSETASAGCLAAAARTVLSELERRGKAVMLVGGSGLYLSAIVDGLIAQPPPCGLEGDCDLESRLESDGLEALREELGRRDPAARTALSRRDVPRILRALELSLADGRSRAERWQRDQMQGLAELPLMFCLTMDRERLYRRIDDRVQAMLEQGWVGEVEWLLASGFRRSDPGMLGLGYAEIAAHLEDGMPLPEAVESIRRRTRRYAKRQLTWFRRDRRLRWLDLDHLGIDGAGDRILGQWEARRRFEKTGRVAGR